MNEKEINEKLRELIRIIANTPTKETKPQHKDNTDNITKSLTDLRICLKYLLLDLEATRRERDYLRVMLSEQQSTDDDDQP